MQRSTVIMVVFLFLTAVTSRSRAEPKGPAELPERLHGLWKVSLCISHGHCWIRFENRKTDEVHTMGKYPENVGGRRNDRGQLIGPNSKVSGVQWDLDLKHETDVQNGKYLMLSVLVKNPPIYRGRNNGFGYNGFRNNCASFARNAWHYYSREGYPLTRIPTPEDLRSEVLKRHPRVVGRSPKARLAGR